MVVGDATDSSGLAPFVGDATQLLLMPCPITEQTLVDARAVSCRVPIPLAPLASVVVLFGAVFPSVREVIESSIEHGS
jgi:hypothetical protein